ncbi:DUF2141 domain-containing protein [Polaribacter aquimarinus]|uniref:DUF2141 domain-containing protein n=1 Tax=Polaribacter aquimarinus TaxID=2100726 RepID=A0A2U2J8X9_9FLAO|nr:DUF2141 domain-containing protein [Polaribacter aquimarinus]PWG04796.1 hypothetical protein DIS07_10000 [Polaribacter aquimarinus]
MKLIVAILTTTLLMITHSITAQSKTITATVINVTSDSGKVGFALYNKSTFMKTPIQSKNAKIIKGKSTVTFDNITPGEYAIICFHDKNNNDIMDFEPNGMPKEDYGASNNVMNFGPPNYEDAKFIVSDKNVSLDIKF